MSELSKPEEELRTQAQGPVEAQLLGPEAGETASAPPPVSALAPVALNEMVANLIKFLLLKYPAKELTSQVKMLKKALRDNQEHFPAVFSQASQCLQLVCGVEVKKVEPREHIYIMVPTMGLTYDVMLNSGQGLPRASLLVLVLSLIMWNADHAPEEKVWGALSRMGVCVKSEHCNFGEPRELLTHTWVQEGYLAYRQVPDSHPARSEFLWVPQAYAETSKWEAMAFLLRVKQRALRAFPPLSTEAAREEDEAA
ncbi:melanoma-associated antigen 10-like [Bos indicus x Bos taurus]|uniref:melanoma-associated antigen 10-like n=1 Tax=Bos indicus x Bos taurus TaxID=30522 RepID=UPI000F7D1935|nr:melanoma-associated antigen 10-like [Bos indicus x Bos taurus]